jgi:hypothetical protein
MPSNNPKNPVDRPPELSEYREGKDVSRTFAENMKKFFPFPKKRFYLGKKLQNPAKGIPNATRTVPKKYFAREHPTRASSI